jgi:hypothetical protein
MRIGSKIPFTILAVRRMSIAFFASHWDLKIAFPHIARAINGIPIITILKYITARSSVSPCAHSHARNWGAK